LSKRNLFSFSLICGFLIKISLSGSLCFSISGKWHCGKKPKQCFQRLGTVREKTSFLPSHDVLRRFFLVRAEISLKSIKRKINFQVALDGGAGERTRSFAN
jgi:hypothetical protein